MTTYHYTDQLGQAVTGARAAAAEALDQLAELDDQLAAEREMHRATKTRLLERAEDAELERDQLEAERNELQAVAGDLAVRVTAAEQGRATAQAERDDAVTEAYQRGVEAGQESART